MDIEREVNLEILIETRHVHTHHALSVQSLAKHATNCGIFHFHLATRYIQLHEQK